MNIECTFIHYVLTRPRALAKVLSQSRSKSAAERVGAAASGVEA
jgi:hypothetical protein